LEYFIGRLNSVTPPIAVAQDSLHGTMNMGFGDIAAIKQKAEAGDSAAQVALGDSFASRLHAIEALDWYRKAALNGSVEGRFHVGDMLLFGAPGIPQNLAVRRDPSEGLRWTFMAATNFHPHACWNMGKALRQGIGTSTNLIAAYAWLNIFVTTGPGSIVGRVQMNEVALQLDGHALKQAQALAASFKSGKWQMPDTQVIAEADPRLALSGITLGRKPLAVINGKSLSEGESASISLPPASLKIKCLKIQKDSVVVEIDGESAPRILHLK
jgi:TPR repeat protein